MPDSEGAAPAPPVRKAGKPTLAEREAQALRANLRRRKQQASLRAAAQTRDDGDEDPSAPK